MISSRILVTGAAGFVGSHLLRRLVEDGRAVGVILRGSTDTGRISDLLGRIEIFRADLQNLEPVGEQLLAFRPDCCVDLAWQGVSNRFRNDLGQLENLRSQSGLFKILASAGCRTYVGLGSQAEYGPYAHAIAESTPTHPTTVYGLAKLCCGLRARYWCGSHGVRYVWLRLFSSYGPGDDPNWLLPYVIRTLLRGERPSLTAGEQRWDFVHISDAVDAVLAVISNPAAHGVFNVGSGEAPPLRRTVEAVRDLIDPSLPLGFGEIPYRPDQVMLLQADISRLREIGWGPKVSLADGMRNIVDCMRVSDDA